MVIELKRDDSGADAYWQAIKYASYLRHANSEKITEMLAGYADISLEDAGELLLKHLDADDFDSLNREQRIILASHRFAPEATSAVLWLNAKYAGENLITCVQLTPYRDEVADSLYLQANTIIPLPGEEEYMVKVGSKNIQARSVSSFAEKLRQTFTRNRTDEVTRFFRQVRDIALSDLPADIKPDKHSKWAGGTSNRYYKFWYKRPPWKNWGFAYAAYLDTVDNDTSQWKARVGVEYGDAVLDLKSKIRGMNIQANQEVGEGSIEVPHTSAKLDDDFASAIAGTFRLFIEKVTPVVDLFMEEEANQEDA